VRASFLTAVAEFQAEASSNQTLDDREPAPDGQDWTTASGFESFVASLRAQSLEETPRPAWQVPQTNLWWIRDAEYLGRLGIRHRLTPALLEVGGHIGYAVRPTARRRGHATAMLHASLTVAYDLGITEALITCDADNIGSRRVIENNGGILEDQRGEKLRFWVPTRIR
jgi:predicted acetyltransferase